MTFYDIFRELNKIPRSSHHEEKVADYICNFANELGLEYDRDAENCVVIRKPASKGYENAESIVLLNHMDMVAVSDGTRDFDPLTDGVEAYVEDGWMKARGTSLGADNGIGLSMALAVLADDSIKHGPLEVLTTTNEEDGMTGAANLSEDFIRGRKVINLDSEDYDTITVGAAGAYLQIATFPIARKAPEAGLRFFEISVTGGLGGHSGVDINKNRINAIKAVSLLMGEDATCLAEINGGSANASIPGDCKAIVGVAEDKTGKMLAYFERSKKELEEIYAAHEPNLKINIREVDVPETVIADSHDIKGVIRQLPFGPLAMHETMAGTVMTSNNIGVVKTNDHSISISCHTRSFSDQAMVDKAKEITAVFEAFGAEVEVVMNTPGWQENTESEYLSLVDTTFKDVLGFSPRQVAMHFVLEAGYYVQKYPGIEIACIGPRIVEPHSTSERIELSTADDIWKVLVVA